MIGIIARPLTPMIMTHGVPGILLGVDELLEELPVLLEELLELTLEQLAAVTVKITVFAPAPHSIARIVKL